MSEGEPISERTFGIFKDALLRNKLRDLRTLVITRVETENFVTIEGVMDFLKDSEQRRLVVMCQFVD